MKIYQPFLISIFLIGSYSWLIGLSPVDTTSTGSATAFTTALTELTDREYPHNPDKKYRSRVYTKVDYNEVSFQPVNDEQFDIAIFPTDKNYPKVTLNSINLMEYIPTIPKYVAEDEYLSLLAVVNQEWNRNQITFKNNHFSIEPGKKAHKHRISRVEIARSCLNSYLWEVYFYTYNPLYIGKHELMYHGWFEFPKALYQKLFFQRNNIPFEKYAHHLEEWKELPTQQVDLTQIRKVVSENSVDFEDLSDEMYPLEGERKKKRDEILYPRRVRRMTDFHTDKAKFSSFVKPGMYVRKEKRPTELSRFQILDGAFFRQTKYAHISNTFHEIELVFNNEQGQKTKFFIGGIQMDDVPIVLEEKANDADLFSMGIGNHTFYENYLEQQSYSSKNHPFFSMLINEQGEWLDSHKIGIDGPLIHRDAYDQNILHIWILSYERHALVGHYKLRIRR